MHEGSEFTRVLCPTNQKHTVWAIRIGNAKTGAKPISGTIFERVDLDTEAVANR